MWSFSTANYEPASLIPYNKFQAIFFLVNVLNIAVLLTQSTQLLINAAASKVAERYGPYKDII